jgi:hypothetical protein
MKLLSESPPPRGSGRPAVVIAAVLGLVAIAALAYWAVSRSPSRTPARPSPAAPRPEARPAARAETGSVEVSADAEGASVFVDGRRVGPAPQRVNGLAAGSHRVRVEKTGLPLYELEAHVIPGQVTRVRARLAATAPVRSLRVESDVPDASVFLDRKYLGKTPVEVEDVESGPHRLNVSAEGYEMYAETIEVTGEAREVKVRFKEIKLDESVAVAHKHGLGSCEGRLVATVEGLRYQTTKTEDAFSVPLGGIEELSVDYLKSSLRLRLRNGRTYNFSGKRADALLSFQKKVEAASRRLGG